MKFFEIDEEYLKKGGLITRDKKRGLAFGIVDGRLVAFSNGIKKEPEEIFKGYVNDLLANDWEYIIYKSEIWKPNDCDSYYYISSTGAISYDTFSETWPQDKYRSNLGNAFKTEEDAKKIIEKIKIINKLRELSNINFNDDYNQLHYVISYDIEKNKIAYNVHHFYKELPFEVYFATKEDCLNAVKEIGEENLKKYYFDVVDDEKKQLKHL